MEKHSEMRELLDEGIGKCSVPMFMYPGIPAGFCEKPAYGIPPPSSRHMNYFTNRMQRDDNRYDGYVPGLACVAHGGPRSRVFKDGDMFCAVFPDFINLQESESGWGKTPELARVDLKRATGKEAQ
jgi:hypothetical protein